MKRQTFESLLDEFLYHFDLPIVFDDFLTMSIAACGRNPLTGLSYDEALYLKTIEKYKTHSLRFNLPKMFACLQLEMTERKKSSQGNDILGEIYEQRFPKPGLSQFFTPYPICEFMALRAIGEAEKSFTGRPLRILDPACGSGRMLVEAANVSERKHEYYGADIDITCVKMSALNLFLNAVFNAEILCADATIPGEFKGSYGISLIPFGIFRIATRKNHLSGGALISRQRLPMMQLKQEKILNGEKESHWEINWSFSDPFKQSNCKVAFC